MEMICGALKHQGFKTYITTSHPALIRSLNNSKQWSMARKPSRVAKSGKTSSISNRAKTSGGRITASFIYAGLERPEFADIMAPKPVKQ
jgi:hypothetical protein